MADEAKDLGDISKSGNTPGAAQIAKQQEAEPEVRILEEHVTHAAGKSAPPSPIVLPVETKVPPATQPIVSAQVTPKLVPTAPQAASTPKQTPSTIPPSDPIADDVGLVLPPRDQPRPPHPAEGPIPVSPPAAQSTTVTPDQDASMPNSDISKILAEVALPERRESAISGERYAVTEPKKFDTSIVGSALNSAEKAAPASPLTPAASPMESASQGSGEAGGVVKDQGSVSAVHTLKDDLRGVVHDQKISIVRAVSLEENRRARKTEMSLRTPAAEQRSHRTFGIIFSVIILLGLGSAALFGVFFVMNQQKGPLPIDTSSSILFAEQSVLLSLDNQSPGDLKRVLEAARAGSQGTLGSIVRIVPVMTANPTDGTPQNRAATFKEFITALGAHPTDDLLRAVGDDFFLGIHAVDKNAPILILSVTSYDRAFAAMLNWEDGLNADLAPLFTPVAMLAVDANSIPTKRTYEDLVMHNYDVRALKDDTGTIELYYSFPTQNILVIAESPYSFAEILSRLQAGRKL